MTDLLKTDETWSKRASEMKMRSCSQFFFNPLFENCEEQCNVFEDPLQQDILRQRS